MLVGLGSQPFSLDVDGYSSGHGVDLLMLEPTVSVVVAAEDVYSMIVHVHLGRMWWRACAAADPGLPQPVLALEQLTEFAWLDGQ